jgi:NitT/TauT family transport system permease protein
MRVLLRYSVSLLVLIAVWEFVSRGVPDYLLPPPYEVAATLYQERGDFLEAALVTLGNAACGGALGIILGVTAGLLISYSRPIRAILEPWLIMLQSFPREALLPLMIVWVGFGHASKIASAALLSFFPSAIITMTALSDVRPDYLELIRGWGANRSKEFLYCRLPVAVPVLIGMLKVAIPLSLIGALLGEFMGGNDGLGHIIISEGAIARVDRVFGAVVVLGAIGMMIWIAIQLLERADGLRRFREEQR